MILIGIVVFFKKEMDGDDPPVLTSTFSFLAISLGFCLWLLIPIVKEIYYSPPFLNQTYYIDVSKPPKIVYKDGGTSYVLYYYTEKGVTEAKSITANPQKLIIVKNSLEPSRIETWDMEYEDSFDRNFYSSSRELKYIVIYITADYPLINVFKQSNEDI